MEAKLPRSRSSSKFLLTTMWLVAVGPVSAQDLGFERRVQAQEALERAIYSHQLGNHPPFEEAVPRAVLEAKVRTYLERSFALEEIWQTPITQEMLQAETARMMRETRMPDRLRERFAALGDDPLLIRECLARPALAERLVRNFFDFDTNIQAGSWRLAETMRDRLASGWIPPTGPSSGLARLRWVRRDENEHAPLPEREEPAGSGELQVELSPSEFAIRAEEAGSWESGISPVLEEPRRFVIQALIEKRDGEIRLASYSVPKRDQADWWRELAPRWRERAERMQPAARGVELGSSTLASLAQGGASESLPSVALPQSACPGEEAWDDGVLVDGAPESRYRHTAVWTGSWMLVWGGSIPGGRLQTGGRYDPATDTWSPMSTVGAPSARLLHTAVWTGAEMIVWGGSGSSYYLQSGGRYNPLTDSWVATSTVGAPPARNLHTAVWTGSRMIVWGGDPQTGQTGGSYDPASDSWSATSLVGAPTGRRDHVAVWTGSAMVIWGGEPYSTTGGRYYPATDSWAPTSLTNVPAVRKSFTAVWTGSRMVVWGGSSTATFYMNSGGRYDPVSDTWSPTSTSSVPAGRHSHLAIWDGTRMIVWGGFSGFPFPPGSIQTGGRYDPISDTWTATSLTGAPSGRAIGTAVWTGNRMVVWGGTSGLTGMDTGGRYDPVTDSWTPTGGASGEASPRRYHTSVWTGNEMIIWGGTEQSAGNPPAPLGGSRYDPATALWVPVSNSGAPAPRYNHAAVWTGTAMIVWGGTGTGVGQTGGRYYPITDTWSATSVVNAPTGRAEFGAVWTGSSMVVWGGSGQTGGRYDPVLDLWTPTSVAGAPAGRIRPTAIWTGQEMVVWGGVNSNTGGRYDPVADSWQSTSLAGAPTAREGHTAVWTGTRMIVWGGYAAEGTVSSGASYDPVTDSWKTISSPSPPAPRARHSAVWTGSLMLVWGGSDSQAGGRYEPITDTWTPTTVAGAPVARAEHTATWTGEQMVIWGGITALSISGMGGLYCTCANAAFFLDDDGDGFGDASSWVHACAQPSGYVTDSTDCSDATASLWRIPGEARDFIFLDEAQFVWNPPLEPGATLLFYDVIRSDSAANFVSGSVCLATAVSDPASADASTPALGGRFHYLVRARNDCIPGLGPLGAGSDGTARTALVCP